MFLAFSFSCYFLLVSSTELDKLYESNSYGLLIVGVLELGPIASATLFFCSSSFFYSIAFLVLFMRLARFVVSLFRTFISLSFKLRFSGNDSS